MPLQSTSNANSCQPPSGWSAVTPIADEPGDLIAQLNAVLHFCTQTDTHSPAELRWRESRFYCLPHVTDPPERWSIDTEELRS